MNASSLMTARLRWLPAGLPAAMLGGLPLPDLDIRGPAGQAVAPLLERGLAPTCIFEGGPVGLDVSLAEGAPTAESLRKAGADGRPESRFAGGKCVRP